MVNVRSMLNILVIAIMVFLTVSIAIFIYISLQLKSKITVQTVQKTEFISDLITHAILDDMSPGHGEGSYVKDVLEYNNIVGIDDIGIFKPDGREAFDDPGMRAGADSSAVTVTHRIEDNERNSFKRAVESINKAGYFNWDMMTYTQFVPLRSEGGCTSCHKRENELLGVLKIRLMTDNDLKLLHYMQRLIWTLGFIVILPVGALLVAGAIIREKNRIYRQLEESNRNLTNTYSKLIETGYYLQMILDNSKVIIITTDIDGKIVEFNKEAEALLEYSKEELAGENVLILYDNPADRSALIGGRNMYENFSIWAVRNREVVLISKSGRRLHVSLTLSTMVDDHNKIIGTVGVGKDISEHKMLQFKLMQSEKLAGIGTLASGIAHEINNPLAGILGMAEAIRDEGDIGLIKSYTNDIIQYAINASSIVRELSAYSRSAHNESRSTVDMAGIIENSLKMARHSASLGSIELVTELARDCFIIANSGEIQQVFVNLIINAIHAMDGKGTLALRCAREGTFIRAAISDTGKGIPPENLSQIYDPFFTTKPAGMGTGLGLYVVYRIVTKHKGVIDVDSKVGDGTTFTLKFPSSDAEKKLMD